MGARPRLLALAAVLVAGVSTSAAAQPPAGGPPPGGPMGGRGGPGGRGMGGGMQRMMFEGITLTAAQQASVDSIQLARREAMRAQMQQQGGGPPDDAARAAMRQAMEQDRAAIRALLTADQQRAFDANVARMQERQRQRMQGGAPGGGPSGPDRGGRD